MYVEKIEPTAFCLDHLCILLQGDISQEKANQLIN